jgi:anthranilate phosphoribosyltransferase
MLDEVKGGDAAFNARALELLLRGEGNRAYRDIAVLNAAAALVVSGKFADIAQAAPMAAAAISDGRALAKFRELRAAAQRHAT